MKYSNIEKDQIKEMNSFGKAKTHNFIMNNGGGFIRNRKENMEHKTELKGVVLVTGIVKKIDNETLYIYFTRFGKVLKAEVILSSAIVEFIDEYDTEKALYNPTQIIDGIECKVHRAFIATKSKHKKYSGSSSCQYDGRSDISYGVSLYEQKSDFYPTYYPAKKVRVESGDIGTLLPPYEYKLSNPVKDFPQINQFGHVNLQPVNQIFQRKTGVATLTPYGNFFYPNCDESYCRSVKIEPITESNVSFAKKFVELRQNLSLQNNYSPPEAEDNCSVAIEKPRLNEERLLELIFKIEEIDLPEYEKRMIEHKKREAERIFFERMADKKGS